jgi:hypothetical protein
MVRILSVSTIVKQLAKHLQKSQCNDDDLIESIISRHSQENTSPVTRNTFDVHYHSSGDSHAVLTMANKMMNYQNKVPTTKSYTGPSHNGISQYPRIDQGILKPRKVYNDNNEVHYVRNEY